MTPREYKQPQRRRTDVRVQQKTERLNLGRRLDEELDHLIQDTPGVQVGIRCHMGDHEGCSVGSWCECPCGHPDPLDPEGDAA